MRGITINDDVLGTLWGRDCIFVDEVQQKGSTLIFKGQINGSLASKIHNKKYISFELTFKKVIKYSSCELDTYSADERVFHGADAASFLVVQDSEYLKDIPVRYDYKKYEYKHFLIYEYDFVYNVFAVDYELKCNLSNTVG